MRLVAYLTTTISIVAITGMHSLTHTCSIVVTFSSSNNCHSADTDSSIHAQTRAKTILTRAWYSHRAMTGHITNIDITKAVALPEPSGVCSALRKSSRKGARVRRYR